MWPLHVIDAVFQMFLSKFVPGNMYISAVLLKTNLRVLYIAALISMVRSSLLKRPSSCRSSSSLIEPPTSSSRSSSSIIERFRERQALRSPLRETGLKMFNHMTKGFKVIHAMHSAIERKYPTSRGFIAMIQRKRLLKFYTWAMRERRKKRAAAAAASDRLTADEAMIEAGLEAVAPDELHIIYENQAAPCGSAESPAPSTAPSVMIISSEEEYYSCNEGDECDERSPSSDSRLPHWQPGGVAYERAASRMRSETAPVPSFLSDEERGSSRVERGPHKAKELQQPKAPAVRTPPAAPREPADYADAPCGSCIKQLLR